MNSREQAIYWTKETGILPAIKIKAEDNLVPYVHALREGGARLVEITMTTPGALAQFEAIRREFGDEMLTAAGTVLDAATARAALLAGVSIIVSPAVIPEVIATANRYGAACYAGAFTATECLTAMQAGADMVKVFPATIAGPKYMTNLKMVYPELNLIPSGGVNLENAADFIRAGACAVSGARNFVDQQMVQMHGPDWIRTRVSRFIDLVCEAKKTAPPLP